jgi:hypothetical protein
LLAYDQIVNACDDYNKIGNATTFTYFKYFVRPMKEVCELEFLKQHTRIDLEKKMKVHAKRVGLDMFDSLDNKQYCWKNYLVV